MKYISKVKYLCMAAAVAGLTGCGDFGDLNIDPEHINEGNVPYAMLFTNAQHQALGSDWDVWRAGLIYTAQWNQHIASGGWTWDYGVNSYSDGYAASYWESVYSGTRGAVRDVTTCVNKWKDDEDNKQNYEIARIMRVYIMNRLTDLYGDVPYFQAGQPEVYSYPVYDKQEDIYKDMLAQLDSAQAELGTGTASMGVKDIYYQGDVAKWKKFANSLMLRLAMRLVKADPSTAKTYAEKAYNNGCITSTSDNCYLSHPGGSVNDDSSEPFAKICSFSDIGVNFINQTFYDILAERQDPRIPLIMCVVDNNVMAAYGTDAYTTGNADPAIQKGLPGFYSFTPTSDYCITKYPAGADFGDGKAYSLAESDDNYFKKCFSIPNRLTYADPTAPTFVCTAAQTNLLLAEAALRGYIGGDAATFYREGIRCAMEQFSAYPNATSLINKYLTDAEINAYIAAHPLNTTSTETAMKDINIQYYITCFGDEYETWANWRRSGYPELTYHALDQSPDLGNYIGLVRRLTYPSRESTVNGTNYVEALKRQWNRTTDFTFTGDRVWWDKE